MTEQISTFFTIDMIFLWLNIGVIPFWFILMFFPNSKVCGVFVSSIFPIFTLSVIYLYLIYYFFISGYDFTQNFTDVCHHGKEEEALFPALEKAGMPTNMGPIHMMLLDHKRTKEIAEHINLASKKYLEKTN